MVVKWVMSRVATAVVVCALVSPAQAGDNFRKAGDVLQVALPVAAMVCAARKHDFAPAALRFVGQEVAVEASKHALGNASINQRPNGNSYGFPSGHTAAAFYGASYLSRQCLHSRGGKILAFSLATAVGASRIHANSHTVGQVIAGALVGVAFDRVKVTFEDKRVHVGVRYEF
ncbi:phosphatase PAP2 family protein [Profundibacter sp.]